jgi:hypothetical protein
MVGEKRVLAIVEKGEEETQNRGNENDDTEEDKKKGQRFDHRMELTGNYDIRSVLANEFRA